MRKTKKVLSIILVISMLFCVAPAALLADATANSIEITVKSVEKTYDGIEVIPSYDITGEENLQDGDVIEVTLSSTDPIVDVSSTEINANYIIKDSSGEELTQQDKYDVTVNKGNIVIKARRVVLTSATKTKAFDNTELTDSTVDVTGDGFINGEGATYKVTGTQTQAGSSKNTFTYELYQNTKEENYSIETVYGDLTVTPTYTLGTGTVTNGSMEIVSPKEYYEAGEDVTVTVTPKNSDYNIIEVYYILGETNKVTISNHTGNDYTFKMPAADIVLQATFEHINAPEFAQYIIDKSGELSSYLKAKDKQSVKDVANEKIALIKAVTYDDTKSLEENKAVVDNILSDGKSSIDLQRNIEVLNEYKLEKMNALKDSVKSDDSIAAKAIIDSAVSTIGTTLYDSSKTYDQNKNAIDGIVNKAFEDQTAQRDKDIKNKFDGQDFFKKLGDVLKVIFFPLNWIVNTFSKFFEKYF